MTRITGAAILLAAALTSGCATLQDGLSHPPQPSVTIFSKNQPDAEGRLPDGWQRWTLSKLKKPTRYTLVDSDGRTVVHAQADASASGLVQKLDIDPREFPLLAWQWKTMSLIKHADNHTKNFEDSPVRVVVTFAGDLDSLSFDDRVFFDNVRALTRQQMPYATLMYIWENRAPVNAVLPNQHTSRIKMVVAASGEQSVGRWQAQLRNIYEDYKRAFNEEPGRITSIAVMSDTDNTGESVEAYYGDISFRPAQTSLLAP
jgi:hypothetical protein